MPPIRTAESESLSHKPRNSSSRLSAIAKASGLHIKRKRPSKQTVPPPVTAAEDPDPIQVANSDQPRSRSSGRSFLADDSSDVDLEDIPTRRPRGRPPKVRLLTPRRIYCNINTNLLETSFQYPQVRETGGKKEKKPQSCE